MIFLFVCFVTRSDIDTTINEGYVFTVTFSGNYVPGNVPELVVGGTNTLGNGISTNDGSITVQIDTTQEGNKPGFKLTYASQTTGCIAWDQSGDTSVVGVDARLEALSTVTTITSVVQSSISAPAAGYAYTIVFGSPSTPISLVIDATISGCDAMPSSVNHNTVVSLDTTHGIGTFGGGQYFTLSFDASTCSLCRDTTSIETGNIDWERASSGQGNENSLQSQLNELANIANSISDTGTNGVVVTRSDIDLSLIHI